MVGWMVFNTGLCTLLLGASIAYAVFGFSNFPFDLSFRESVHRSLHEVGPST